MRKKKMSLAKNKKEKKNKRTKEQKNKEKVFGAEEVQKSKNRDKGYIFEACRQLG